jgi:tRNA 5-methylaminomethyl-2-thiouridine biosynthesis bifunctional protein
LSRSPILFPAACTFDVAGQPYSTAFGDVYHSADGALGQARHVFLGGNELPLRWRDRRHFAVLETGFGFGINFLATWAAWREDPRRCEFLHFVSVEKHPPRGEDLAAVHARHGEVAELAAQLGNRWPMLLAGVHRLAFEEGHVTLTLGFGDVAQMLPNLRLQADAIYLDGFAPDRNPDMWAPGVLKEIMRKAAVGTTLATWSAAGSVRRGLEKAGFEVESRAGFGAKREMSVARFAPRWKMRRTEPPGPRSWPERRAVVIGAGLAGAAVAERLCARDWNVELIERHRAPASEASGNHAGVFHPLLGRDDGILARLTRAGFLLALDRWQALERSGHSFSWSRCGVLLMQASTVSIAPGLPEEYARSVDRSEASGLAGVPVKAGGILFPLGGWVQPQSLVRALIGACGERLVRQFGCEAASLERRGGAWTVKDEQGKAIASAPVVIFATGTGRIPTQAHLRFERVRGLVSCLPASAAAGLRTVLQRDGFVIPAVDGKTVVGATYGGETISEADAHRENLGRLQKMLHSAPVLDQAGFEGRVGYRAVPPDRLPIVGALADEAAILGGKTTTSAGAQLAEMPRMAGHYAALGYGSRGLVWAPLGAELLAAVIEGEPQPVEGSLARAIDPARFLLRFLRK